MQFPTRPLLALAVLGICVAGSSAALTLPNRTTAASVEVPTFSAGSAAIPSTPGVPVPGAEATPPVTGAQIASIAIVPARDRVTAIVAEQVRAAAAAKAAEAAAKAEAERPAPPAEISNAERLRDEIRRACDAGALRGPICRSV